MPELSLLFDSVSYFPNPEREELKLIVKGKIKLKPLISHEFPLEKAKVAFDTAAEPNFSVKVLIIP